ncbi:hypothetical protein WDZ16_15255 [Pseudokineococcus marinus]|nr:hypothetical protein [Pseudokineococcus marinus]
MAVRAREGGPLGTGSVREVFLLLALGLFMIAYGGRGVGSEDVRGLLLVPLYFAMAAGVVFLLAAFFGARKVLRQRRR